jgi:curved DNA-binding protein CbpA
MIDGLNPTTTGNFDKTPFAHILIYLFEKRISGTLDVRYKETEVSMYFRDGTPAKVQTDVSKRGLGHVLLVLGQITEDELQQCNAHVEKMGCLQGKALTDLRILDVNGLVQALKKQIVLKMTDVFAMNGAEYAFYNKVNKLAGFGPDEIFPVHPYTIIMSGLRTYYDRLSIDPLLAPLLGKWLVLGDENEKIRAFRLSTQEKQIIQYLLKNPVQFPEVLNRGPWKAEVAKYVLYGLRLAKLLNVSDTAVTEAAFEARDISFSSIPPLVDGSPDPAVDAVKKALLSKAEEIASQNYYEMLGIDRDASIEDVRRAYFMLSKSFHPDKLPQDVRISLKEAVHYVYSNLTEAHTQLLDPKTREKYDRAIAGKEKEAARQSMDEHMEVRDALDAENLFQRALVFLNKGEVEKSAELMESALTLAPKEGEYLALATHLKAISRPDSSPLIDLEKKLRQAASQCPKSERVNLYLAEILKRQSKFNEAKACYKKILEINPRNINAAREIRLIDMKDKRPATEPKGFIKRFFE